MGLGIMVSINQRLDAEVIELVASELDLMLSSLIWKSKMEMEEDDSDETVKMIKTEVTNCDHHGSR